MRLKINPHSRSKSGRLASNVYHMVSSPVGLFARGGSGANSVSVNKRDKVVLSRSWGTGANNKQAPAL